MAIAFRAAGTRLKADVGVSGGTQTVGLPSGHVSGDCLILICMINARTAETVTSTGWNFLGRSVPGVASGTRPWPNMSVYWRVDNGSLGSTVGMSFDTSSFPTGDANVLACILAWSGTHATNPIGQWGQTSTTTTPAAQAHPQLTTTDANDWLVTARGVSDSFPETFAISGGTNAERVDDTDGFSALSFGLYDSNSALAAGLQTQRTTTADGGPDFGSTMFSVSIRPAAVATAVNAFPGVAMATGTAYSPAVTKSSPVWDACGLGMPVYKIAVDWTNDGDFNDPNELITGDTLDGGVTSDYGRDQNRQLNPNSVGNMTLSVNDADRKYSPENLASPLAGNLDPARNAQASVTFNGQTYYLFTGKIDDYNVNVDRDNRSVDFTFLDNLSLLQGQNISTPLYRSLRTGEAVNAVLDQIGWAGPRDIDLGATFMPFWWAEGSDAFDALNDIVRSEGPPALAYAAPDGTFIFRDRHHRILREESISSQATFAAGELGDCTSPAVTGFDYTAPFSYLHGWRDIVNSVSLSVDERSPDPAPTAVWTSTDTISLNIGDSQMITVSTSDPFMNAVAPVAGTDYQTTGVGLVTATLLRDSGAATTIRLDATGGSVVVTALQLRAISVPIRRTKKITAQNSTSISTHGERSYPNDAPWANANDAQSIASLIVAQYAERKPTVQLRVVSEDPQHWIQVVTRTLSDRITIVNQEMGLAADFFVEHVAHTVSRINSGRAPVHAVVLSCEKGLVEAETNPFTFNKKGAGFDQGVFDPTGSDKPGNVFIFDDPQQGQFDFGQFGT